MRWNWEDLEEERRSVTKDQLRARLAGVADLIADDAGQHDCLLTVLTDWIHEEILGCAMLEAFEEEYKEAEVRECYGDGYSNAEEAADDARRKEMV